MDYEHFLAEMIGGFLSGLRYIKQGWVMFAQVMATGWGLAHFVGADVAKLALHYTNIALSYGTVLFLVAYFGPTALDRINLFIKALQVDSLWKRKK